MIIIILQQLVNYVLSAQIIHICFLFYKIYIIVFLVRA